MRDTSLADAPSLLIGRRECARLCAVSPSTWDRLVEAGRCPKPIRLSSQTVRWKRDAILNWIAAGCPDSTRKESP